MPDRLDSIADAIGDGHGCIFFSPTKGWHCDILCRDTAQSWVTGSGESIPDAVDEALRLKKEKEYP